MLRLYDEQINKIDFEINFIYSKKKDDPDFIEIDFLVNNEVINCMPVQFDNKIIECIDVNDDLKKEPIFGNIMCLSLECYRKSIGKVAEIGKPIQCKSTNDIVDEFYKNLAVYIGTKKN